MDRLAYLTRRLLLVVPTFLGITLVCFALTRFLPGGPVEMRLMRLKGLSAQNGQAAAAEGRNQVSDEYRKQLEVQFGFDKPLVRQYWDWLVVNRMGMSLPSYDYPDRTAWQLIRSRIPVSVWFGLASPRGTRAERHLLTGDRATVRRKAVWVALGLLLEGVRAGS